MPDRRIIAVSADPALGQELATALGTTGASVELRTTIAPGGLDAALCVLHVDAAAACALVPQLTGCPLIVVLARSELVDAVAVLQAEERIVAIASADELDPARLSALAARVLADDLFGLEKVMAPGTEIQTRTVRDYREKSQCMNQVAELVETSMLPRSCLEPIEQCLDEMLMNALYDAPVDAQGKPLFAGIPTKQRITMRTDRSVVAQYAYDGNRFAISVKDAFGRLERRTVLTVLYKCLHATDKIDRKAGGAGVGLYLMVNSAAAVYFHVLPGIATEVICVFDVERSRTRLEHLGFLVQRDARGQVATGPARRVSAIPLHKRTGLLASVLVAAVVVLGVFVWPGLHRSHGEQPAQPVEQPHATVELESQPAGATIEIDGNPVGSTPLTLTTLVPRATVSVVFKKTGYRSATTTVHVPEVGKRLRIEQPLQMSDDFVRVHFVSDPPGAEVVQDGVPEGVDRTYTPADVLVEAGKLQRFTLTMPGHVPLVIEPFTPTRGSGIVEKGGTLAPGTTLHVEATREGTVSVAGVPHCTKLALPADCTLAPGTYTIEYDGPTRLTRSVIVGAEDVTEKFELE